MCPILFAPIRQIPLWIFALLLCSSLHATTVVIDAGHGGHDRGGIPGQVYSEKALALDLAKRLRSCLEEVGIKTVMTRNDDTFVSLPKRVAIANGQSDALFISIHFNSARREGACGSEVFFFKGSLASSLANAISKKLSRLTPDEDRGVKRRSFYVIRKTRIPAVLVEGGFLTNKCEGARINTFDYRQKMAAAIAAAIIAKI